MLKPVLTLLGEGLNVFPRDAICGFLHIFNPAYHSAWNSAYRKIHVCAVFLKALGCNNEQYYYIESD